MLAETLMEPFLHSLNRRISDLGHRAEKAHQICEDNYGGPSLLIIAGLLMLPCFGILSRTEQEKLRSENRAEPFLMTHRC
jgi:hypothetical protein